MGSGFTSHPRRFVCFVAARTVAAVISAHLVTLTLARDDDASEPPELIDADVHLLRAPR